MPRCVVCGAGNNRGEPLNHDLLDSLHLRSLVKFRTPTIGAQLLENQYKAVARK